MRDFGIKVDNTDPLPSGILFAAEDNVRFNELKQAVSTAGIALDAEFGPDTDTTMLAQAAARYASGGVIGVCGGVANTYTVAAVGSFVVPKSLFDGMLLHVTPSISNTGASLLNAFSLGLKDLRSFSGTPLVGGEFRAGRPAALQYSSAAAGGAGAWLLMPWGVNPLLPIFPEITDANNVLAIASATGSVVVSAGGSWIWRGIQQFTTDAFALADRTFATVANKTYHLVWDAPGVYYGAPADVYGSGKFTLIDRTAVDETNPGYDTIYDRMLIARVVTNGANLPTVTQLKNKAVLVGEGTVGLTDNVWQNNTGPESWTAGTSVSLNWARRSVASLQGFTDLTCYVAASSGVSQEISVFAVAKDRYGLLVYAAHSINPYGRWVRYGARA